MEQWRIAGPELERIRRQELRALTDDRALKAIHDLIELGDWSPVDGPRRERSGLVEQQALFQRQPR